MPISAGLPSMGSSLRRASVSWGVGGDQVKDAGHPCLAVAMNAPHALFQARRYPGQVVVDHVCAELEIDPLAGGFGRHHDLTAILEVTFGLDARLLNHATVDLGYDVAPALEQVAQKHEGVFGLGEDQQLLAILKTDPHFGHDRLQLFDLRFPA